jgi:hypothetical protein
MISSELEPYVILGYEIGGSGYYYSITKFICTAVIGFYEVLYAVFRAFTTSKA